MAPLRVVLNEHPPARARRLVLRARVRARVRWDQPRVEQVAEAQAQRDCAMDVPQVHIHPPRRPYGRVAEVRGVRHPSPPYEGVAPWLLALLVYALPLMRRPKNYTEARRYDKAWISHTGYPALVAETRMIDYPAIRPRLELYVHLVVHQGVGRWPAIIGYPTAWCMGI